MTKDDEIIAVGTDPDGIERCWGRGPSMKEAEEQCWKAAQEYVAHRPDTAPLSKWEVICSLPE